jgi:Mrp family chromosome partitioning ATPase
MRNPAWDQVNGRAAQLQIEADSLGRQLDEVRQLRAEAEQRRATLLTAETVLRDLIRRRDALEGIVRAFTTREAGARLEEDARRAGGTAIQVVQPATAPLSGVNRAPLFAAAGVMAGLTFAGVLLMVFAATRRSLSTRAEARETLGLPALAGFRSLANGPQDERAMAELAAQLLDLRRGRGHGAAVLLLPAGDGPELARALAIEAGARSGRPTLLLDLESDGAAHLRALGGRPETVEERVEGHVLAFPTACETLWVAHDSQHSHLTDGRASAAEAERLLTLLRREFELILMVGGAPRESYALRRLAGLVDGNVLVVNAATTTLLAARTTSEALRAARVPLPGFVFTGEVPLLPRPLARMAGVEAA